MTKKQITRTTAVTIGLCLAVVVLFRTVLMIGYVPSSSMEPTIRRNSFILADRTAYWSTEPQLGDVIAFLHEGKVLVKRVAATAGEVVMQNELMLVIPPNCVYVLGDYSAASIDSRYWDNPFIANSEILGRVLLGDLMQQ